MFRSSQDSSVWLGLTSREQLMSSERSKHQVLSFAKMFMRVAVSVFLFLARVRFPNSKSIAEAIRARYNGNNDKRMQKLEKIDYRLRKAELDLEFLCNCSDNNAVSKFLNFRVANNHIKFSTTYEQYQSNLRKEEIRQKKIECTNRILQKEFTSLKSNVRILQKEFTSLKSNVRIEFYRKNLPLSKHPYKMSLI